MNMERKPIYKMSNGTSHIDIELKILKFVMS